MRQLLLFVFAIIFSTHSGASDRLQNKRLFATTATLWTELPTRFASASKWQAYGKNTIADKGDFVQITIKNKEKGAYLYLDKILPKFNGNDNKNYKITFSAFVEGGNKKSKVVVMQDGIPIRNIFNLKENETKYTVKRTNGSSKRTHIAFKGLPKGAIIYIKKHISIEKMRDRTYAKPFALPFKGATLNMDRSLETEGIQQWFFDLHEAGVKYIRVQTNPEKDMKNFTKSTYLKDVISRFKKLYLPKVRQYGMKVLFAFESIPYDNLLLNNRKNIGFWESSETAQNFIDTANYTASTLKDIPEIFAFQFMSEPIDYEGKRPETWEKISLDVISTVRQHTNKFIAWSNGPLGASLYDTVVPFDDNKIIYNFHEFKPYKYTHQGIKGNPLGVRYRRSAEMLSDISSIIAFRDRNNAIPIMCGSFALANWIPDGVLWASDLINHLEDNNISSFNFVTGKFRAWDWRFKGINNGKNPPTYIYDKTSSNKLWTMLVKYWRGAER